MEAIIGPLSGRFNEVVDNQRHPAERSVGPRYEKLMSYVLRRVGSLALIPMTIAPFAAGSLNPMMDGFLISLVLIHSHLGFEYVPTLITKPYSMEAPMT